jgi:ComF family protein
MTLNSPGEKSVVVKIAARAGAMLGDLLFPPRCLSCGVEVDIQGNLCPDCWKDITFLSQPFCDCCGYPFDFPVDDGILCAACIGDPPPYAKARAIMRYDEGARKIILRLKHGDRLESIKPLARWLMGAGAELLAEVDYILPVPLHRRRLFQRRYNQSALLGKALEKISGKPMLAQALLRIKATSPQQGLKRQQRHENMRGAFAMGPGDVARLKGRSVLLVDDVYTTGATVEACAKVLLKAGVKKVAVLTLARVVLPDLVNI